MAQKRQRRKVIVTISPSEGLLDISAATTKYTRPIFCSALDAALPVKALPELLKLCANSSIIIINKDEEKEDIENVT